MHHCFIHVGHWRKICPHNYELSLKGRRNQHRSNKSKFISIILLFTWHCYFFPFLRSKGSTGLSTIDFLDPRSLVSVADDLPSASSQSAHRSKGSATHHLPDWISLWPLTKQWSNGFPYWLRGVSISAPCKSVLEYFGAMKLCNIMIPK